MTYNENSNVFLPSSNISCPSLYEIYVATTSLGVYFSNTFVNADAQPIWETANTGLPALDCLEFHLDPFHKKDRQYVLIGSTGTLYRRYLYGAWEEILTPAELSAMFGGQPNCSVKAFCTDPSADGKLWAAFKINTSLSYGCYSNDYGDTWTPVNSWWNGGTIHGIRAYGDYVYVRDAGGIGDRPYIEYSYDRGGRWDYIATDLVQYTCSGALNPLLPNKFYYETNGPQLSYFYMVDATLHVLQNGISTGDKWDTLWFHPTNSSYQRLIYNNKLYVTLDEWVTINTPSTITNTPKSISTYMGSDPDLIILGLTISHGFQEHTIGVLMGENSTTSVGIAGANPEATPYAASIPYNCGGACNNGIQFIEA